MGASFSDDKLNANQTLNDTLAIDLLASEAGSYLNRGVSLAWQNAKSIEDVAKLEERSHQHAIMNERRLFSVISAEQNRGSVMDGFTKALSTMGPDHPVTIAPYVNAKTITAALEPKFAPRNDSDVMFRLLKKHPLSQEGHDDNHPAPTPPAKKIKWVSPDGTLAIPSTTNYEWVANHPGKFTQINTVTGKKSGLTTASPALYGDASGQYSLMTKSSDYSALTPLITPTTSDTNNKWWSPSLDTSFHFAHPVASNLTANERALRAITGTSTTDDTDTSLNKQKSAQMIAYLRSRAASQSLIPLPQLRGNGYINKYQPYTIANDGSTKLRNLHDWFNDNALTQAEKDQNPY